MLGSRTVKVSMRPIPAWPIKTGPLRPFLPSSNYVHGEKAQPAALVPVADYRIAAGIIAAL